MKVLKKIVSKNREISTQTLKFYFHFVIPKCNLKCQEVNQSKSSKILKYKMSSRYYLIKPTECLKSNGKIQGSGNEGPKYNMRCSYLCNNQFCKFWLHNQSNSFIHYCQVRTLKKIKKSKFLFFPRCENEKSLKTSKKEDSKIFQKFWTFFRSLESSKNTEKVLFITCASDSTISFGRL